MLTKTSRNMLGMITCTTTIPATITGMDMTGTDRLASTRDISVGQSQYYDEPRSSEEQANEGGKGAEILIDLPFAFLF